MKIIHTADWHLGHQLYNYDRSEEFGEMMSQIIDAVVAERPDALLVCGDVFNSAQPPVTAQRLFADSMTELHRRCPQTTVIVTAGNHDSAARHEIFAQPWRELGVIMVGALGADSVGSDPARYIIKLPTGYVAAVPWCSSRVDLDEVFGQLREAIGSMDCEGLPVVAMAHAAVQGCDTTGHADDGRLVGGLDCLDAKVFGEGYDYVALGHIHRPQTLSTPGETVLRYSGTPLAVSFDETYEHTLTVVEIEAAGCEPKVREITVVQPRPLVTIPAQGAVSLDEAILMLESFPSESPAYIRLNVAADGFLAPDADHRARNAARGKMCRFCLVNAVRPKASRQSAGKGMTVEEFRRTDPLEILTLYADKIGQPVTDELRGMFAEAIATIND